MGKAHDCQGKRCDDGSGLFEFSFQWRWGDRTGDSGGGVRLVYPDPWPPDPSLVGTSTHLVKTERQDLWAGLLSASVKNDMVAIGKPPLEHAWNGNYSAVVSSVTSEIDDGVIDGAFDAAILEVAFHDNQQDAELLRDPKVRDWAARAAYEATVKYFGQFSGDTIGISRPRLPDRRSGNLSARSGWSSVAGLCRRYILLHHSFG